MDEDGEVIDFTHSKSLDEDNPNEGTAKLVLLRIVDDEVVEAYVIIPD